MKKVIYFLIINIMCIIVLAGCHISQNNTKEDLSQLAQIEIYSGDGDLIRTITNETILKQFNPLMTMNISSDLDFNQDELEKLIVSYTIIFYKVPVAIYNDGTLEKLMEMTIYKDSNITKEQMTSESIKGDYIPEEYLTFYSILSDEDKASILSLIQ